MALRGNDPSETITERALERLQGTVARMEQALSIAPFGVGWIDGNGRLNWCNPALAQLVGKPRLFLLGQAAAPMLPLARNGVLIPIPEHPISGLLSGGEVDSFFEWRGQSRQIIRLKGRGATFANGARCVTICIIDASNTIRMAAALSPDEAAVQRKEELETIVEERTAELRRAAQEYELFAYTVAHDLRAPLRQIRSFGDLLVRIHGSALPLEARELLNRMTSGASSLDRLVEDLLAYSRIARAKVDLVRIDPEGILERVIRLLSAEMAAKGARIEIKRPMPMVVGNAMLLEQALTNLVANAAKFVAPGVAPQIVVRAEQVSDRVRLWVEDNGIGVPAEFTQRIFRIFERLHSQDVYPGTGVGLAIVARAAERMRGSAGVEPGESGSRFWIELPFGSLPESP